MQIVIEISETLKKIADEEDIKTFSHFMWSTIVMDAIKSGIPLPKGHGDLIDRSKISNIYKAIYADEDNTTGIGMTLEEMYEYNHGIDAMYALIKRAKSIIEADKSESGAEE